MGIAGLLARRSVSTWSTYVAKALPVFAFPPFIFARFPAEEAALWFIFITLQGMQLLIASSTDLPMVRGFAYALGGATQLRGAHPAAQKGPNMALFSRVWAASAVAHLVIGIATFALLGAMGIWSAAPLIDESRLWWALAAFVCGGAIRAWGGLHVSYLMGVDRIALLRWWEAAFAILSFIFALITLLLGGGLLAVALAYQAPLVANVLWNASLCRRDQADRPGFVTRLRAERGTLAQLWPSIWRTGLGTTLFIGATQGAGLYYATIGGAREAAAFLFVMSLIRPLGQFAQVPFMTKLPQLARLQAEGRRDAQRRIAERSMRISYALHAAMVIAVAVALPIASTDVPLLLWLLIGLAGYVERMGSMHLQLYATTNHVLMHWANGLAALLYIGLAALMLPRLGVYAFALAQILALAIAYVPIGMRHSYRAFGLSFPAFEIKTAMPPLLVLLTILVLAGAL